MQLSSGQLSTLLNALGLSSLLGPIDGVVSAVDGITHGLGLPGLTDLPLVGGMLEAKDTYGSLASNGNKDESPHSCTVAPYDPPPILSQTFPPFDEAKANIFRYRKQQSVNLGSW